jgi:hypothetical protein
MAPGRDERRPNAAVAPRGAGAPARACPIPHRPLCPPPPVVRLAASSPRQGAPARGNRGSAGLWCTCPRPFGLAQAANNAPGGGKVAFMLRWRPHPLSSSGLAALLGAARGGGCCRVCWHAQSSRCRRGCSCSHQRTASRAGARRLGCWLRSAQL